MADPLSGNHMMSLDVSVHLYDYMMATLLVFIVSLSLYISTCLSMCFYQFSFPALIRGFLWCETLLHPGKTCDPPVGRPESSGSARSHEGGGGTLHLSHSKSSTYLYYYLTLALVQGWSL